MSKTVNRAELLKRLSPAQRALLLKELQKEAAQTDGSHDIPRRPQAGPTPLSFSQQRLWFLSQVDPDTPLYNVPEAISLEGQLNVAALAQSLNEIIRRHDSLRTVFTIVDRQPVQICTPSRPLALKLIDLAHVPPAARELCARRLVETEARRPFNLTNDALLRATLLRLDDEHHWAILTLHHIVADGWSMGILIRETAALYQAFARGQISPLPELPIQYTDFTQWQREWLHGERLDKQLDYWKQQLAGAPPLQLPTDRPRSAQTTLAGARLNFSIPKTLGDEVKRLSDREGVTLFMTLLAAFKVLLFRYAQQRDIVVGTAIANRHHGETENLIGFFLNILVLRTALSAELTFRDLLQHVKEVALAAYEHQDVPFDKLVEELQPERQLNRNPFFQVVLAVHSGLAPTLDLHELSVRQLPATSQTSKYDLSIEFVDTDDALTGFLEYSTELFEAETIERLLGHYQTLLESIVKNPEQSIARLQFLPQPERRQLLALNNDRAYAVEHCLHELVAAQVERTPDAIALNFENQLVTYGELDQRANQLAHHLRALGVGPDVLVSIFMERSVEMVVGLLAVLKAGGAYVPIDPAYPPERVAFILEDTAAAVLLTQKSLSSVLPPHSARVVCLDEQREQISGEPLTANVSPDNLAYIIYTSGSTGKPKGVMVTHRNVCRLFDATQDEFAFSTSDVWTLFHSYAFDFSVWEMWGALLYGGRLVIVPYLTSRSPDAFYEMLVRERVTVLNQTPSAFRQLCQIDEVSKREVQQSLALRLVIFGGEALDFESLGQWFRDHGDEQPQLVNMYGITETTVHVTERRVRAEDLAANTGSLIGHPISDLRGYVLDQHMELLPAGVPGELYVGGAGVARGYLWRPELSAERFVPDPFRAESGARLYRTGDLVRYREGELEYLGRVDQQVKIRGFRIEPGEIESALEQHDEVREAVVIASEDDPSDPRLIAYIVAEQNHVPKNGEHELSAEQVAQWEMVFNENYSQPSSQPDPTFNITGWTNSYTGAPIAEDEMRDWLDQTIDRILSLQPQNVLEIGCGTGLLLFRLAPHCARYVATDFSPIALDYIQQTLSLRNENLPQLELYRRTAENFEGIESNSFDLVILNSVVQYFPSIDYLLRVIEGAVRVVKPGGSIFIGDVRSLPLLEAFHRSIQLHQAPASLPAAQLEQRVKRHMAQEEELVIDPDFFSALREDFSRINDVRVLSKQGRYQNEMTQFRYDVILRLSEPLDTQAQSNGNLKPWTRYANNPLEGRFARRLVPKLRSFLQEQLPDYMVPSAFVLMDAMPLTQHGKINRRALPAPEQARPELEDIYVAPGTHAEKELAAMFAHVLGVTQVGLHDNFFDLGGHSLLATQLLSRIRETFSDKEITLRHIFESPTVAGLAREIEATETVLQQLPPLVSVSRDGELPLSFAQQRLWFLDQLEPGTAVYNCPAAVRFNGALNLAALKQSFDEVLRRHETLRTRFAAREGNPVQVVATSLQVPLPIIDLSELPRAHAETEIERLSRLEAQRAFDLSQDLLLRTKVLRVSGDEHVVLVTMHHIISDGWSIGVLVKEVAALYEAYANGSAALLPPLEVQYADYAHWEREWLQGEVLDEQLDYWRQQLAEAPVLELPTDHPRPPVPSYGGAYESFELDQSFTAALNELSRRLDATLFMTLLAAWQTLLHRYTGQNDIVVGTPIANRHQAETDDLIGFFVNMLAMRTDLSGNPTFRELVQQVRETALGAYAHQALPFEKLIEELQPERSTRHTPLVQVVLALQNAPQADLTSLDLKLHYVEVETSTAKYDIVVNVYEVGDKLSIVFTYSTDLFEAASMQRLGQHYKALLAAVVEKVDTRVSELDFLSSAERRGLLVEPNATSAVYPVEKCVHELFEEQVQRSPEAVALVSKGTEITYAELQRRAALLATHLHQRGVGPGSCVGIFLDHSIETVVAILGVLRAGAAYVPLDTDHPRTRLAFIFEDAQLETVLAQQSLVERLPLTDRLQVILIDSEDWQRVATEGHPDSSAVTPADAAYVIYTSGSTGQPKGVKISHRALVNYLSWCREVYVKNEEASFALYSSLAFDLTVTSIFTPLLTGNRLIIYGRSDQFPVYSIVQDNLVDVLKLTPSHLALIKDLDNRKSRVKRLIVGGESLTTELAAQVNESFGGQVEILNEYGPTEATVGCMIYRYDPQRDRRSAVPIGRPAANVQIYVLDRYLKPVPENVIGELYISGAGLADGYLNRAELTAEKFIANPFVPGTRMYRSGDRARWLAGGEIEYLGRDDEQVKYHGYRIELSEISSALNQHPHVRNSVVLLRPDHRGEDTLVAYYVSRRELETAELREFLRDYLIKETIPNVFIHLARLPLTLNGKVDYRALPELQESKQRKGEYVAPRTVVEEVVADIWANLLGIERVSLHDNFFELGGHSLIATQVMVRVQKTTSVELPLRALFENPTVAQLAAQIEAALRKGTVSSAPPLVPVERGEELPLSFAQQRLWFLHQLEPESAVYNCPVAVRFTGALNLAVLAQTLNEVVRRHEVLRTRFSARDGSPVQIITSSLEAPLQMIDLSGLPAGRVEAALDRLSRLEAQRPFDLNHDAPLRTKVFRVSLAEHVVLVTMHHIVSDGWSIGVLVKEVAALYEAYAKGSAATLKPLAVQYADYAHWEKEWLQGEVLAEQLEYWKQQVEAAPVLELPADRVRPPVPSYLGASESFELDQELSAALSELSRRLDATLFMTLLAAWQTLLHRYSGQSEIVVGTPIANRQQAETEELIGFFVNMLALRTDMSGNPTFAELVQRVRETALGAYAHQALPFEKLIEELQLEHDTSHSPLVQVLFALQNTPQGDLTALDLKLNYVEVETGTAKFDLTLSLQETAKGLSGWLEYSRDLFEAATIKRLLGHFKNLLRAVVAQPDERIAQLPLLEAPERQQLLEKWNDTATVYERESGIHELFEAQVARWPAALAAISDEARLTYDELNQRANQLAWLLRQRGVGPETLVGVSLARSERLLIALLGILKAGGAYVFLDASYPPERLALMVQDAAVRVLVTEEYLKETFSTVDTIICLDSDEAELAAQRSDNLPATFHGGQQLSYVSYTSGSTGIPKGVAIPHQGVVRLVRETNYASMSETNVFLQLATISFDASTWEIWGPLLNGGCCVLPAKQILTAAELGDVIKRYGVDSLFLTTAMFNAIINEDVHAFDGLRQLLAGGELCSVAHFRTAVEQLPQTKVSHVYGPTENTTYSSYFPIETDFDFGAATIPIGQPIANSKAYILDEEMQPVPIGVVGELYVGGDGLARGYISQPELTAEKFVPDPFSQSGGERLYRTGDLTSWCATGQIEFIGRRDRQVKLRGFRIELGEVEAVLKRIPEVREAVVALNRKHSAGPSLVAYVVADGLTEKEIRASLQSQLPAYMVPGQMLVLDRLPLTRHGKVNLEELGFLLESTDRGDEGEPPATETEQIVAEIWGAVLEMENLGRDANFFELGGHSLIATQVKVRLQKTTGVELPLRVLFENPTVAQLAAQIDAASGEFSPAPVLVPVARDGELPLSFAQQRLWFLDQLEPGTATYNCPAAVRFTGTLNLAALAQSFNEVVRRHEALRTRFSTRDGSPVQIIASSLEVPLPLVDLSGLPARRVEAEIDRLSRLEAQRAFDLSADVLLRVKVLRVSAAEHVVLLTMHHIISDGWSIGVLVKEVAALYEAYAKGSAVALKPLDVQYADYAHWERDWLQGEVLAEQLEYWKEQLAAAPVLELPFDRPRPPAPSYLGAIESFELDQELTAALNDLSRRLDATLFMTLLAAWQVLLYRYSGQRDMVVGTPIANRHQAETEELIGFFVNMLPLRTDVGGNPTFAELVQRVRETALGAYAHQALPFEKLIEELQLERDTSHSPLVQVVFALQNAPQGDLTSLDLKLNYVEVDTGTAKYDLVVNVYEIGDKLPFAFNYSTDLFDAASMQRLGQHFKALLAAVVENAGKCISELDFLSPAELEGLIVERNATASVYPVEKCVPELFNEQVSRSPEAIAVVSNGTEITYAELQRRAELLAGNLHERGIGPGSCVGIFLEHSIETVVAILGVLRAGAAYVPLDTEHPRTRLAFISEDAQLATILTQESLVGRLPVDDGAQVILMDREDWQRVATEGHPYKAGDAAYVIYTSGSTGQPKGVKISHGALVNYLSWCRDVYVRNEEASFALYSSLAFDLTVTSLFTPLLTGNRLIIYDRSDPLAVQRIVRDNLVDVLKLTPSHLALIKDLDNRNSRVKRLIVGGESLATELAAQVHQSFGGQVEILNEYGPTEATVGCMIYRFDPQRDRRSAVPIGRPAANVQIYVLDEHLNPTPENVTGELFIAGAGLADGYVNRAELTAEKFIANPFVPGTRMYRSGDRARWLTSGELEYLGRADEQVKYHGYRIELSEISNALNQHPQVRNSVVLLRKDHRGEDTLVAYYVARREIETAVLREFLLDHLIRETIPNVFIHLTRLPLTLNGKVDYRALPELKESKQRKGEYVAPRTVVEEVVADIWASQLGLPRVSLHDNFFELGGHSLIATQVMVRVQKTTGVELPLRALFESPTVAQLAAQVDAALRNGTVSTTPPIVPVARDGELPLSFSQQRLWFLDQLTRANAAYHIPFTLRLSGPLNRAALKQAFNEIIRRHETLRTTFAIVDEQPAQVVGPVFDLPLPTIDLEGLNQSEQEAWTLKLATQHAMAPFDLSGGPLLRACLLRINEQDHILLAVMHHIVSDGWSLGRLIREVATLYEAFSQGQSSPLPELAVQYADFASWQREWLAGERLEEKLEYWKQQLAEAPILTLPTDRSRPPVQTFEGARCSLVLPESLSAALKDLSRETGATLFMTMLAGFHALLHRYAQQARILTGTPVANRTQETEPLIGFFVNTLVLSSDFTDDPSFVTHLERLRSQALAAYTHQDLPFELLVEKLQMPRDLSYNPLFQVMFNWDETDWTELGLAGLGVEVVEMENPTSQFDLTLMVRESAGQLHCFMQYSTALFDEATIERMLGHYEELLRGVVREPQQRVSRVSLLPDEERQQLVSEFNDTRVEYETGVTLVELFERQVERDAAAVAVVSGERQVTYRELNERANRVARHLMQLGVDAESRVGLLADRGIEMVVGLLGIIKAGAAYVPLDPGYPRARLEYTLRDAALSVVLTERRQEQLANETAASVSTVLCLDDAWAEQGSGENLNVTIDSENLAYVIYTSGSTGQPKGVMNTHRGICNRLFWMQDAYQLTANDRVLQKTPFSFDVSVWEFFWPLLTGARLVMAEPGGHQNPAYLRQLIEQEQITTMHFVPAMLQVFLEEPGLEGCTSLRQVFCSGEALSFELQQRFFERLGAKLHNLYGPTEAAVDVTYWACGQNNTSTIVPIGKPIANTQIYILDRNYEPVPVGVPGELHIGGVALARGYHGQTGLTAEKFVADPFSSEPGARLYKTGDLARYWPDGAIEFLGRSDHQVKLRGFRIELGEIEAVLKQYPGVREVVVVDRELKNKERQLVAYVVGQSTAMELRDHVRSNLPEYMTPSAFVFLPALPLSPSGKIDRRALPLPDKEPREVRLQSGPLTELEQTISEVWRQVLQVDQVGVHDNFFDIGGHSLLMVQVQRNLAETINKDIQLVDLFKYPTIKLLAKHLGSNGHQLAVSPDQKEKLQSGKARMKKLKSKQAARVSR